MEYVGSGRGSFEKERGWGWGKPTWKYVGQGLGSYEQKSSLNYVGAGRGSYDKETTILKKSFWEVATASPDAALLKIAQQYAAAELVFDVFQCFVLWWLIEEKNAQLKEENWQGKLMCDFLNLIHSL